MNDARAGGHLADRFSATTMAGLAVSVLLLATGASSAAVFPATGEFPVQGDNPVTVQDNAIHKAMENALDAAVRQAVSESVYQALLPLVEEEVLPQAETFVTNYTIEGRSMDDLVYSVRLSANVDGNLLRRRLIQLGILKGPESPLLVAIFGAVDPSLPPEAAPSLMARLSSILSGHLEEAGMVVIPPPAGEMRFRPIPPPAPPEALAAEGRKLYADLSVGTVARMNPAPSGGGRKALLKVAFTATDAGNGALAAVQQAEVEILLPFDGHPGRDAVVSFHEMSSRLAAELSRAYPSSGRERTRRRWGLSLEGASAIAVRDLTSRLLVLLGDDSTLVPRRFSSSSAEYELTTGRPISEVVSLLRGLGSEGAFSVEERGETLEVRFRQGQKGNRVREHDEAVVFYRKAPRPGEVDPDDILKTEVVPWAENEPDDAPSEAAAVPLGEAVVGNIQGARDHDFYLYQLPPGTAAVSLVLEQSGPGEFRPRVRVFNPAGGSLYDGRASARGRSLRAAISLQAGTAALLVEVEDDLGRFPTRFPYVLKVAPAQAGKEEWP